MKIKWIIISIIGLLFFTFTPKTASACEIEFEILKGKKESYKTGDTLIVLVKVALTHRSCPVKMKATKFKMKGLKVIQSTAWKQTAVNDWERKLKIVVTESENGKLNLTTIRECEKDGGFGTLKLEMSN